MRLQVEAGRMILDPFSLKAVRELYAVRFHPTVREFMSNPALIPYRSHVEWAKANLVGSSDLHLWLVRPNARSRAIGFTQLKFNSASRDTAEVGIIFRDPDEHQFSTVVATGVTLYLAFVQFRCTWLTSYVMPSHRRAIAYNLTGGGVIVDSDRPGMIKFEFHRDTATSSDKTYSRVMKRLAGRLTVVDLDARGVK